MQKHKSILTPRLLELLEPDWQIGSLDPIVKELDDVFWLKVPTDGVEESKHELRAWIYREYPW